MKTNMLALLLFLSFSTLSAQTSPNGLSLDIGYFSQAAIHPGSKLGITWTLEQWELDIPSGKDRFIRQNAFQISPQIAYYVAPDNHRNFLLNVEMIYRFKKAHRRNFSAFSIGMGTLQRNRLQTFSVNLGSGETEEEQRERVGYFLPSLSYTLGRSFGQRIDGFTKFSYAYLLGAGEENSARLFFELGLQFQFRKTP
ncbi:MAG: hypothetical protein AAFP19_13725 [Bacteroidota bacterium]